MENMALVLEKKMPLHLHVHRSDDICTAIRIGKEYDLDVVLIHCTDGRGRLHRQKRLPRHCWPQHGLRLQKRGVGQEL